MSESIYFFLSKDVVPKRMKQHGWKEREKRRERVRCIIQTGDRQEMSGRPVPGMALHSQSTRKTRVLQHRQGNSKVIQISASFFISKR